MSWPIPSGSTASSSRGARQTIVPGMRHDEERNARGSLQQHVAGRYKVHLTIVPKTTATIRADLCRLA